MSKLLSKRKYEELKNYIQEEYKTSDMNKDHIFEIIYSEFENIAGFETANKNEVWKLAKKMCEELYAYGLN